MEKVNILPLFIGALGTMTKNLKSNLDKLGTNIGTETVQKAGLLSMAQILRRVLDIS